MWSLIIGLALFIGIHFSKSLAPGLRAAAIGKIGEHKWKGLYTLVSLAGLLLIIYGYSISRDDAPQLFEAPVWSRSLLLFVMPVSLSLLAASNLPTGYIKSAVRHPMVLGVSLWSLVHLIGNGDLSSVLLFGVFLVWSIIVFFVSLNRENPQETDKRLWADAAAIFFGLILTWLIVAWLHEWLIGVPIV